MAVLSAADRKAMPAKDFAGPGRSFPMGDRTHAKMAISGATRSERAGNISSSEEDAIKAKARAKLGGKDDPPDHKSAVAKMHPEHVHKLVQDAHSGKYGPQAQQVAQMATQPQQSAMPQQGDGDADDTGGSSPSSMFSSGGASPAAAAPPQPANRASMFQGR